MLRTNAHAPLVEHEQVSPGHGELGEALDLVWVFLRRQYSVILFTALLTIAVAIIYLLATPPRFSAHTGLILDVRRGQFFQQQSILADAPTDAAWVESQVEIVKSQNIAETVIENLHLTEFPEFVGSDVDTFDRLFSFIRASARSPRSKFEVMRQALEVFEKHLAASRLDMSYVLDISFTSNDADRAAQIANSVADTYVVDQLNAKFGANQRASNWLQDRANGLRDEASVAENAVVAFKQENGIVAVDGKLMNEQQIADLSAQLVLARGKTAEALARLDRIEAIIRNNSPTTSDALVTDALNNSIMTKLREQYLGLVNREAAWSARYGPNHLAVVNLRNQIYQIRDSILLELKRYVQAYRSDYEIARHRQESLEKDLASTVSLSGKTNRARVKLHELESAAQSFRTLHDNFLQRYTESVQQQSFPITEARVISRAAPPFERSSPRIGIILPLACFGGLGLGAALGFIREVMDRVFRTTEQVEAALNAPCVAMVPFVANAPNTYSMERGEATTSDRSARIVHDGSARWIIAEQPLSRFAEAIRSVKLAGDLSITGGHRVIGFTSALPHEGKSTVAVALGHLTAQVGGKVIIVDCDLRNPSLSRSLAPNATRGIIEVLAGDYSLDDTTWSDGPGGMTFLPASSKSRVFHTSEVLASQTTAKLFHGLRERYDYVIVDLPPLAPLNDVRATPHLVDGYFLVVEWGRTKLDVVQYALKSAPSVRENLFGAILNKVDMEHMGRYDVHRRRYYYNKHFARYGYTD